ncbi:NAD-dependent epimerase/dehydratase family protein [Belliella kenyensis]|uniref:NAD-dependent epimerase/dehydratase family protein n=1 Tax=Belliella kenyensis TaxID=1472724 RepID=A0ABV8EJJ1_9BACT|nr:NAD-dependent epimerase/dehydratase family protein [Belliella kenyensis]MCH7403081.1 NAD-dependent epimerase/dehydratase family protein [Belliella kenyensis]MDN3602250.1 NAD-dependent epimerase/dehydratase family protein [Belliella kenyensis]
MERILIIGAAGQLGSELTFTLSQQYGGDNIIASDLNPKALEKFEYCKTAVLDIMDQDAVRKLVKDQNVKQIYHLAAVLSATGEKNPRFAWQLNMDSLLFVLELAMEFKMDKIYWPSSIAVFGPNTPKINTPQFCVKEPNTVYGISKQAGERWCEYYFQKFGVDVRSLRYPGLIGYKSLPGGGTTDYAVDIYHKAIAGEHFDCFLSAETALPMMYMPDAIKATLDLMHAPKESVKIRSSYNLAAISFTPEDIYQCIKTHHPDFTISYSPDFRQSIADSWPDSIDDTRAREDWGWNHEYDLKKMTEDILRNLPAYLVNF